MPKGPSNFRVKHQKCQGKGQWPLWWRQIWIGICCGNTRANALPSKMGFGEKIYLIQIDLLEFCLIRISWKYLRKYVNKIDFFVNYDFFITFLLNFSNEIDYKSIKIGFLLKKIICTCNLSMAIAVVMHKFNFICIVNGLLNQTTILPS